MKTKNCAHGLIIITLLASTACSTQPLPPPQPVTVTETIYLRPPSGLVQKCEMMPYEGRTNGELLEWAAAVISLLTSCNRANYEAYQREVDGK